MPALGGARLGQFSCRERESVPVHACGGGGWTRCGLEHAPRGPDGETRNNCPHNPAGFPPGFSPSWGVRKLHRLASDWRNHVLTIMDEVNLHVAQFSAPRLHFGTLKSTRRVRSEPYAVKSLACKFSRVLLCCPVCKLQLATTSGVCYESSRPAPSVTQLDLVSSGNDRATIKLRTKLAEIGQPISATRPSQLFRRFINILVKFIRCLFIYH